MTGIELLKQDHQVAIRLIDQLEHADSQTELRGSNLELFGKLKSALALHTFMEEQIFYHSLANLKETEDLITDSYAEHRKVDELLVGMTTAGKEWKSRLNDLKNEIEHHVAEEEGELFPRAERLLPQSRLEEMGSQMSNLKQGKAAKA